MTSPTNTSLQETGTPIHFGISGEINHAWYSLDNGQTNTSLGTSSFGYKKTITISETSGENLENYQVKVILDTQSLISQSKMQSNCADIRFKDETDTTDLSYWLESGCNTNETVVWVKVPLILADDSTEIIFYYGNEGAASGSDGDATFEFFDDFSFYNSSKWSISSSSCSISGGILHVGNGATTLQSPCILTYQHFSDDLTVDYDFRILASPDKEFMSVFRFLDMGRGYGHQLTYDDYYTHEPRVRFHYYNGQYPIVFSSQLLDPGMSVNQWKKAEWKFLDETHYYTMDNVTYSTTHTRYTGSGRVGFRIWKSRGQVDNYRVRKFASSEPIVEIGSESSTGFIIDTSGWSAGSKEIHVWANNTSGEVGFTYVEFDFVLVGCGNGICSGETIESCPYDCDLIPPEITLIVPVNGSIFGTMPALINVTATDNVEPISCYLYLENDLLDTLTNISDDNGFYANVTEGEQELTVSCQDGSYSKNVANASARFYFDYTSPDIHLYFESVNETLLVLDDPVDVNLTFTAFNNLSPNVTCWPVVDNVEDTENTVVVDQADYRITNQTLTVSLDEGLHKLQVRCQDWASHNGTTGAVYLDVIIDTVAPEIDISGVVDPYAPVLHEPWANFSATDNYAEDMYCELFIDGGYRVNTAVENNTFELILASDRNSITAGNHTLNITCIDTLGNLGWQSTGFELFSLQPELFYEVIEVTHPVPYDGKIWLINPFRDNVTFLVDPVEQINGDWDLTISNGFPKNITLEPFQAVNIINYTVTPQEVGVTDLFALNVSFEDLQAQHVVEHTVDINVTRLCGDGLLQEGETIENCFTDAWHYLDISLSVETTGYYGDYVSISGDVTLNGEALEHSLELGSGVEGESIGYRTISSDESGHFAGYLYLSNTEAKNYTVTISLNNLLMNSTTFLLTPKPVILAVDLEPPSTVVAGQIFTIHSTTTNALTENSDMTMTLSLPQQLQVIYVSEHCSVSGTYSVTCNCESVAPENSCEANVSIIAPTGIQSEEPYTMTLTGVSNETTKSTTEVIHVRPRNFAVTFEETEFTKTKNATLNLEAIISNYDSVGDNYTLTLSGLPQTWTVEYPEEIEVSAKDTYTVPIEISIPDSCDVEDLYFVGLTAQSQTTNKTRTGQTIYLTVYAKPHIYNILPDGQTTTGQNVVVTWFTTPGGNSSVSVPGVTSAFSSEFTDIHSLVLENMTRFQTHTFVVTSCNECGCSNGDEQSFYIDSGVVFNQTSYSAYILRDYDQRMQIGIKNEDTVAHNVTLMAQEMPDDVPFGFVGTGSLTEELLLEPGETAAVELAIFTPDAKEDHYALRINLTDESGSNDFSIVAISVAPIELFNFTVSELEWVINGSDPSTFNHVFTVTNTGTVPVPDLDVEVEGELAMYVRFKPQFHHIRLLPGESMPVLAYLEPYSDLPANANATIRFTGSPEVRGVMTTISEVQGDCFKVPSQNVTVSFDRTFYCSNAPTLPLFFDMVMLYGNTNPTVDTKVVGAEIDFYLHSGNQYEIHPHLITFRVNNHAVPSADVDVEKTDQQVHYNRPLKASYFNPPYVKTEPKRYDTNSELYYALAKERVLFHGIMPGGHYGAVTDPWISLILKNAFQCGNRCGDAFCNSPGENKNNCADCSIPGDYECTIGEPERPDLCKDCGCTAGTCVEVSSSTSYCLPNPDLFSIQSDAVKNINTTGNSFTISVTFKNHANGGLTLYPEVFSKPSGWTVTGDFSKIPLNKDQQKVRTYSVTMPGSKLPTQYPIVFRAYGEKNKVGAYKDTETTVRVLCNFDDTCSGLETKATCINDCHSGDDLCDIDFENNNTSHDCWCGDNICDSAETNSLCPGDCALGICPNNFCDSTEETSGTCCDDCGCEEGYSCVESSCTQYSGNLDVTMPSSISMRANEMENLQIEIENSGASDLFVFISADTPDPSWIVGNQGAFLVSANMTNYHTLTVTAPDTQSDDYSLTVHVCTDVACDVEDIANNVTATITCDTDDVCEEVYEDSGTCREDCVCNYDLVCDHSEGETFNNCLNDCHDFDSVCQTNMTENCIDNNPECACEGGDECNPDHPWADDKGCTTCGNGNCQAGFGETNANCAQDCYCGNAQCDGDEGCDTCPEECVCGPGTSCVYASPGYCASNYYVENITVTIPDKVAFAPGQNVVFPITVKNIGDKTLKKITLSIGQGIPAQWDTPLPYKQDIFDLLPDEEITYNQSVGVAVDENRDTVPVELALSTHEIFFNETGEVDYIAFEFVRPLKVTAKVVGEEDEQVVPYDNVTVEVTLENLLGETLENINVNVISSDIDQLELIDEIGVSLPINKTSLPAGGNYPFNITLKIAGVDNPDIMSTIVEGFGTLSLQESLRFEINSSTFEQNFTMKELKNEWDDEETVVEYPNFWENHPNYYWDSSKEFHKVFTFTNLTSGLYIFQPASPEADYFIKGDSERFSAKRNGLDWTRVALSTHDNQNKEVFAENYYMVLPESLNESGSTILDIDVINYENDTVDSLRPYRMFVSTTSGKVYELRSSNGDNWPTEFITLVIDTDDTCSNGNDVYPTAIEVNGNLELYYLAQGPATANICRAVYDKDTGTWIEKGENLEDITTIKYHGYPNIFRLDNGDFRLYYSKWVGAFSGSELAFRDSSDSGDTWGGEQSAQLSVLPGEEELSEFYDYGFWSPSVVRLENGDYRMYLIGKSWVQSKYQRVLSATSSNAINWDLERGARLEALYERTDDNATSSPDSNGFHTVDMATEVILGEIRYRMYSISTSNVTTIQGAIGWCREGVENCRNHNINTTFIRQWALRVLAGDFINIGRERLNFTLESLDNPLNAIDNIYYALLSKFDVNSNDLGEIGTDHTIAKFISNFTADDYNDVCSASKGDNWRYQLPDEAYVDDPFADEDVLFLSVKNYDVPEFFCLFQGLFSGSVSRALGLPSAETTRYLPQSDPDPATQEGAIAIWTGTHWYPFDTYLSEYDHTNNRITTDCRWWNKMKECGTRQTDGDIFLAKEPVSIPAHTKLLGTRTSFMCQSENKSALNVPVFDHSAFAMVYTVLGRKPYEVMRYKWLALDDISDEYRIYANSPVYIAIVDESGNVCGKVCTDNNCTIFDEIDGCIYTSAGQKTTDLKSFARVTTKNVIENVTVTKESIVLVDYIETNYTLIVSGYEDGNYSLTFASENKTTTTDNFTVEEGQIDEFTVEPSSEENITVTFVKEEFYVNLVENTVLLHADEEANVTLNIWNNRSKEGNYSIEISNDLVSVVNTTSIGIYSDVNLTVTVQIPEDQLSGDYNVTINVTNIVTNETKSVTLLITVLKGLICENLTDTVVYTDNGFAPDCPGLDPGSYKFVLVDSNCNPIEDARINLRKANDAYITNKKTDENGTVDFGEYNSSDASKFEVDYNGAKYPTETGSFATGDGVQTHNYNLTFISSNCQALENVRVNLRKANDAYVTYLRTDENGTATFEIVPEAEMKLEIDFNGGKWISKAKTANNDIILGAEAFKLLLLNSISEPINDARVNLRKENDAYVTHTYTNSEGIASFDVVPNASLKHEVDYNGAKYSTDASTTHEQQSVQTFAFALNLTNSYGFTITDARVNLRKSNNAYVTHKFTNSTGIAAFEVVPQVEMLLEVDYNGAKNATEVTTVSANTQLDMQLFLFGVNLTDTEGQPIEGARVNLRKANGVFVTHTFTDSDGLGRFQVVPSAEMILEVDYNGDKYQTEAIVVTENTVIDVEFDVIVEVQALALSMNVTDTLKWSLNFPHLWPPNFPHSSYTNDFKGKLYLDNTHLFPKR